MVCVFFCLHPCTLPNSSAIRHPIKSKGWQPGSHLWLNTEPVGFKIVTVVSKYIVSKVIDRHTYVFPHNQNLLVNEFINYIGFIGCNLPRNLNFFQKLAEANIGSFIPTWITNINYQTKYTTQCEYVHVYVCVTTEWPQGIKGMAAEFEEPQIGLTGGRSWGLMQM